ncbi:MAG: hypothetical protein ABEJ55_06490 [Halanaeroarchaeum sp.]
MSGEQAAASDELTLDFDEHPWPSPEDAAGSLSLSATRGHVGDTIGLEGTGLPADETVELVWHTYEGGWELDKQHEVIGPQFEPAAETVATVSTTDEGTLNDTWRVPEDYGGRHFLEVTDGDRTLAAAPYEVVPRFELEAQAVPMGETFTVTGYGLGPDPATNNYQVTWDNGMVGYMTGVINDGTATAEVRAVGPTGKHTMSVWRSHRGRPFLQTETQPNATPMGDGRGPVADGTTRDWTVDVTEPRDDLPRMWVDPMPDQPPVMEHTPDLDHETEAELDITPESGTAGTVATITGRNFPANESVDLIWYRHEGHFAQGIPVAPEPKPDVLPVVTTNAEGAFQVEVEIPEDKGATRPITAEIGGESVAMTAFMIQPSIVDMSPKKGPVGTEIEIEISGLGWPIYEMAPYLTYDNAMIGYICSEDDHREHGISRPVVQASGEPGLHFIDVYPSIFEVDVPDFEIKPNLSYQDNHPGRTLPGIHFVFEVTEE